MPPVHEIEVYDDGYYLWRTHGHTVLLQQQVTHPEDGEAQTTTYIHAIVIGSVAQGAQGIALLRAMFGL